MIFRACFTCAQWYSQHYEHDLMTHLQILQAMYRWLRACSAHAQGTANLTSMSTLSMQPSGQYGNEHPAQGMHCTCRSETGMLSLSESCGISSPSGMLRASSSSRGCYATSTTDTGFGSMLSQANSCSSIAQMTCLVAFDQHCIDVCLGLHEIPSVTLFVRDNASASSTTVRSVVGLYSALGHIGQT